MQKERKRQIETGGDKQTENERNRKVQRVTEIQIERHKERREIEAESLAHRLTKQSENKSSRLPVRTSLVVKQSVGRLSLDLKTHTIVSAKTRWSFTV